MTRKKYQVSVAISALNEERTIECILKDIPSQKRDGWELREISVYCDGCTDNTAKVVCNLKNNIIKVYEGKQNKGKVYRINQAISDLRSDILLIFDADCKIEGRNVISQIINEFRVNNNVALVGGNTRVFPPKTFFERAIYSSYIPYFEAREKINGGHNVFGCTGACIALERNFAKKVKIPSGVINEDTYFYFTCISRGYGFRHAKGAVVRYALANNLKVFLKQIFRTYPEAVKAKYQSEFGDLIDREYKRPFIFYLKSIWHALKINPIGTFYMSAIKLFTLPFFRFISPVYSLKWYGSSSRDGKEFKEKIVISSYDDIKNPYYAGGGSVAVYEVAKRFAKRYTVAVYTGRYPGSKNEVKNRVLYKRIGVSFGGPRFGQLVYHLLLPIYVLTQKFDIWIESFTPPFSTGFLQLFTKKPVIALVHMLAGDEMRRKYKLPFNLLENLGLKTYKRFIVLTESAKDKISKVNQNANIKIIPNGVYVPRFKKQAKKNSILYMGRIEVEQKGLDLLLRAFHRIYKRNKIKLVIAGSGTPGEEKYLNDLVHKLDLGDTVEFTGRVSGETREKVFAKAFLLVIPSRTESFSLVALEALSRGVPLVCFDIEGLRWLSRENAYKVKAFDDAELAKAVVKLLGNKSLRNKMSIEGKRIIGHYSWGKIYQKYYQLVSQTLALSSKELSV